MSLRILYAGDSPVGGAANYLLGVMGSFRALVTHLPPSEKLKPAALKKPHDLIIFSDYSASQVSSEAEKLVLEQVRNGTGFLMIGGWGSFSGPFGGWQGTAIEKMLPVNCKKEDDRLNFPGGASLVLKETQGFLNPKAFQQVPAICGLNDFSMKPTGKVLLAVRKIISDGQSIKLADKEQPLLVIDSHPRKRVAALATDLAPHWCGGLVDWGTQTQKLKVTPKIQIQVGNYYVEFISSLLSWLGKRP